MDIRFYYNKTDETIQAIVNLGIVNSNNPDTFFVQHKYAVIFGKRSEPLNINMFSASENRVKDMGKLIIQSEHYKLLDPTDTVYMVYEEEIKKLITWQLLCE
jgi:hypothetical protein